MKKSIGLVLVALLVVSAINISQNTGKGAEAPTFAFKRVYATLDLTATLLDMVGTMRLAPTEASRFYGYTLLASDAGLNMGRGEHQQQISAAAGALTALGLIQAPLVQREMRAFLERQLVVVGDQSYQEGKVISDRVLLLANKDVYNPTQKRITKVITPLNPLPKDLTWTPTGSGDGPLDPKFANITPLIITSQDCILPEPSPEEIKKEASTLYLNFNPEDAVGKDVLWWLAGTGTPTPTGYWLRMASFYISDNKLEPLKASRVLAMIAVADFDTAIELWNNKFAYNVARPETVWQVMFGSKVDKLPRNTPNHPSYPSGHSGFSQAAADVIVSQLGQVPLHDILPPDLYASTWKASWNTPQDAVNEASLSRVHAGFHYPMDTKAGQVLGSCVASGVVAKFDNLEKGLLK